MHTSPMVSGGADSAKESLVSEEGSGLNGFRNGKLELLNNASGSDVEVADL